MATHVNAFKAELEQAVRAAEGALAEVRKKYQALVDKLDADAVVAETPVPPVVPKPPASPEPKGN
jgi:hypothetical protein